MIDDRRDEVILQRARRIGLRRSPFYTYLTWLSVMSLACAAAFLLVTRFGETSDADLVPLVLASVAVGTGLVDVLLAWFLARRLGVAQLLKVRTRVAEEAADRGDHRAVLAALNPVKRFWGSEEMYLTARSRIALNKAGEL